MKYRFMNEHRHHFSLVLMCRVLKVARAGFYQWLHKPLSDRAIEDQRLVGVIRHSYAASGGVYGARRVFGDLREAGETCGKHRVERLMRANKIKAVRGYKSPRPIAGRPSIISPNRLNREFTVSAPNQVWVTDITYMAGLAIVGCGGRPVRSQGGRLGDMCDLVKELAVDAIRSNVERITLDRVNALKWVPPSKRKQQKRL